MRSPSFPRRGHQWGNVALLLLAFTILAQLSYARPNPQAPFVESLQVGTVGKKDLDASKAAGGSSKSTDAAVNGGANLTRFVNVFVGTEQNSDPGNVFAGGTVPFGLAKVGLNVEGYAPPGYVSDSLEPVRGISPLHDSGTGASSGSYGNFAIQPITCHGDDVHNCPTLLDSEGRRRLRRNGTDVGRPGFFRTTYEDGISIELTSTARATVERYTFPSSLLDKHSSTPHLVLDWTNDSPGTFSTGLLDVDWERGRVQMSGVWRSSWAPSQFTYSAYQCVDLLYDGKQQLGNKAVFGGDRFGMDAKRTDVSHWNRGNGTNTRDQTIGQPIQAGVVVGFSKAVRGENGSQSVTIRRGVSFKSVERACASMEAEVGDWDFDRVAKASNDEWETKLQRIQLDDATDPYIRKLFYTSFYRTFLSPNNATGDSAVDTAAPYFDGMYCTWDTFRTLFPLMALSSPRDYAEIVENYIDGYRRDGFLPECRANQVQGLIQGGNHGVEVLADFAAKYRNHGASLGVSLDELYDAMVHDIDVPSPDFEYAGRQSIPFQKYGYLPYNYLDTVSTGLSTRQIARSLEYSYGDFTAAVTASTLRKSREDVERFRKSALNYRLNFDSAVKSDGFSTFVQQRYENGTFRRTDPKTCSPKDEDTSHECSMQQNNTWGIYESSAWEYSFYAPHDGAGLVKLLGGAEVFEKRLDHFFAAGYYNPGNEPSFDTNTLYHHIGKPHRSIERVRETIHTYFNLGTAGIPGNDDNAAMASLLAWYLLGFYPVPGTREMLILSPFIPSYTIHNEELGDVTVKVVGFDTRSLKRESQKGSRLFVKRVSIDGKEHGSVCRISFDDFFPAAAAAAGGQRTERVIEIEVTSERENGCGAGGDDALPMSLSKGGFL